MTEERDSSADVRLERVVRPHATRGGSVTGYKVEARRGDGLGPRIVNGQIFDAEWREVVFAETPIGGIPPRNPHDYELAAFGLMRFEAAQAMRWWWLSTQLFGIETRLRKYEVEYNMSEHDKGGCHEVTDDLNRAAHAA